MESEIDANELRKLQGDVVLIDVRTAEEFKEGYIPGAINMDVRSEEFAKQAGNLGKRKNYVVYCGGGRRGSTAQAKLQALGFEQVRNLKGGYRGWRDGTA